MPREGVLLSGGTGSQREAADLSVLSRVRPIGFGVPGSQPMLGAARSAECDQPSGHRLPHHFVAGQAAGPLEERARAANCDTLSAFAGPRPSGDPGERKETFFWGTSGSVFSSASCRCRQLSGHAPAEKGRQVMAETSEHLLARGRDTDTRPYQIAIGMVSVPYSARKVHGALYGKRWTKWVHYV